MFLAYTKSPLFGWRGMDSSSGAISSSLPRSSSKRWLNSKDTGKNRATHFRILIIEDILPW